MSYEINGVTYDSWSAKNQRILDDLISREVYCCMTSEVEYMLSKIYDDTGGDNPFDEDDLYQMYHPVCSECHSSCGFTEIEVSRLRDEEFEQTEMYDIDQDDFVNGYYCPVCSMEHKTIEEARRCCEHESVYRCDDCGHIVSEDSYNDLDTEPREIYEWWAVSKWFGEKLAEQGCCIIESYGKSYWGRTTTGQAISLDGCVFRIAKKMEILEGMQNDWSAR